MVKNGSKIRDCISSVMPTAGIAHGRRTYSPGGSSVVFAALWIASIVIVSVPPSGMASRALASKVHNHLLQLALVRPHQTQIFVCLNADLDFRTHQAIHHAAQAFHTRGKVQAT